MVSGLKLPGIAMLARDCVPRVPERRARTLRRPQAKKPRRSGVEAVSLRRRKEIQKRRSLFAA
jgi:hypothetical protein